jgi:hypothetical protein
MPRRTFDLQRRKVRAGLRRVPENRSFINNILLQVLQIKAMENTNI